MENASVKFICFVHTYNITYYKAYARHPGYMVRRVKRWKSSIAGKRYRIKNEHTRSSRHIRSIILWEGLHAVHRIVVGRGRVHRRLGVHMLSLAVRSLVCTPGRRWVVCIALLVNVLLFVFFPSARENDPFALDAGYPFAVSGPCGFGSLLMGRSRQQRSCVQVLPSSN